MIKGDCSNGKYSKDKSSEQHLRYLHYCLIHGAQYYDELLPVPGGHLYLNDVIICTAAILLPDAKAAFIVGGVGAFLGDLFFYPTPMFVSLATHGVQALVISYLAHKDGKVSFKGAALGVFIGAIIMVVGYSLGRAFIYSTPHYAYIKLPYQILQAAVGAVGGMLLCFKGGLLASFEKNYLK